MNQLELPISINFFCRFCHLMRRHMKLVH